jgi:hypothetical protein
VVFVQVPGCSGAVSTFHSIYIKDLPPSSRNRHLKLLTYI